MAEIPSVEYPHSPGVTSRLPTKYEREYQWVPGQGFVFDEGFVPRESYYWMTESPQSAESQPIELTFGEEMYKDGRYHVKHWQKVMYTYKMPATGFEEEANPIIMRAEYMAGLMETSFMEVIWELERDLVNEYHEAGSPRWPVQFRGMTCNIHLLDKEFLKSLGLISNAEFRIIVVSRERSKLEPNQIQEYKLAAVEVIPEDWQCAVCWGEEKERVVWHPNKCHSFHHPCINTLLRKKVSCPVCRGRSTEMPKKKWVWPS